MIKFYKKLGPHAISIISYGANIWNKTHHIKHLTQEIDSMVVQVTNSVLSLSLPQFRDF